MALSYEALKELLNILRQSNVGNCLYDLILLAEKSLVENGFHYIQLCKKERRNLESFLESYSGLMSNELDLFLLEIRMSNMRDEYNDLYEKAVKAEKAKALFVQV